jgi:hypothetical protein
MRDGFGVDDLVTRTVKVSGTEHILSFTPHYWRCLEDAASRQGMELGEMIESALDCYMIGVFRARVA